MLLTLIFLIKQNGKTALHTGDFRGQGFRGKGLLPTIQKYVCKIDALIVEGRPFPATVTTMTERELQHQVAALMGEKVCVCPVLFHQY